MLLLACECVCVLDCLVASMRACFAFQSPAQPNPQRSPVEKRLTLKFPGLWDKRNFVWYTDEDGVEHKTNDLIQFLPVPPESNYDPRYNIPLPVHFMKVN